MLAVVRFRRLRRLGAAQEAAPEAGGHDRYDQAGSGGDRLQQRLFFGFDALQLGLVDPQAEENGEAEAHDARHLRERQKIEGGDMLGCEKGENERQDGNGFGQADVHS
jgi:hypothetical protein